MLIFKAFKKTNTFFSIYKIFFTILFLYIKMTDNYYQKHKEKLEKEACERYQNLFEAEKKGQYHRIIVNVIRIFLRNKSRS